MLSSRLCILYNQLPSVNYYGFISLSNLDLVARKLHLCHQAEALFFRIPNVVSAMLTGKYSGKALIICKIYLIYQAIANLV